MPRVEPSPALLFQPKPLEQVHPESPAAHLLTCLRRRPGSCSLLRRRLSHSQEDAASEVLPATEISSLSQKKTLRVAILGRPNAGKSTLINNILKLNICDASPKAHTTRRALKTVFTRGDTQIVFVDTPGLVTKKEFKRFELTNDFFSWKKDIFDEVDIVGIIHEVTSPKDIFTLPMNLVQNISDIGEGKSTFIILNKIDLVIDKAGLSKAIAEVTKPVNGSTGPSKLGSVWNKFSRVFLTSAVKNIGLQKVVDFLLEEARPGEWLYRPSVVCNKPLHALVVDLLRARIMAILPQEVPYKCEYEVEYMEENDLGEMICVALVKCRLERHLRMLVERRKSALKRAAKGLESDLYKITRRVFRLRVVAVNSNK